MQGVKTKKGHGEALLAEAETQKPRERTATEKKKFQKDLDDLVKATAQEFDCYCPPVRRKLYMYLFAKAANRMPPPEIAKEIELDKNGTYGWCIEKYNEFFSEVPVTIQEIILARLLKALESEEVEYEKEIARNEAFDKVLDALSEWTTGELLYLAERIKTGALGLAIKRVAS